MKTIGLLGGMSYESTVEYYKGINQHINKIMGGVSSAKIVMVSFDFEKISQLQHDEKWDELTDLMVQKSADLKMIGADLLAICTNTMHMMASDIETRASIPVLHIAKATADAIKEKGIKKVALLGTKFTMTGDFYRDVLNENGIDVMIPNEADMDVVHSTIYNELVVGKILSESRQKFCDIVKRLEACGAKGVVLGCTEIPLLLKQSDVTLPVFDTMGIHIAAISQLATQT
jgi:aspartate racemase